MKSIHFLRISINSNFIIVFIILYFLYLIQTYIIPNNFEISIVLIFGFAIIITGIFYFFLKIDSPNNIIASVKIINENLIKTVLMVLMGITIFVPAVPFSDVIIVWDQIPPLNYVRAFIFLIGVLFVPGACIFNLICPKSTIHKKLNVEPFLVKLTIYPIISLTFIGSLVLILNFLGFTRPSFIPFLFFSITFLYILGIFLQKHNKYELKNKITEIKISRYTFLLLFVGLGIIIISLGLLLSFPYLIAGDRWRGISSAYLIGLSDNGIFATSHTYAQYWGCISFGLSELCGIPYINTNVILFPFLYLSITSIYLLMKALLDKNRINEKFCLLSSIFIAILFRSILLTFQFSFHSFAFFSLFISLTLFFIVIKSDHLEKRQKLTTESVVQLIFSSLFLFQSLITYFIPALIGIIIMLLYGLFAPNFKNYLRDFLIFYIFLTFFFLIFDLITFHFFSWICIRSIEDFSGIILRAQAETYSLARFFTSFRFYTLLLSTLFLLLFIYKFSSRLSILFQKTRLKIDFILEKKYKYLFVLIFIFCLICSLISNLDATFKNSIILFTSNRANTQYYFLIFSISTLFSAIGFFGFLGISLSYFCYKVNRNLFFFLLAWVALIIGLALSLILLRWIQYPTSLVSEIPEDYKFLMMYWFSRIYYYSIIPLSIFASIGLIKLIQKVKSLDRFKFKSHRWANGKRYNSIKSVPFLFLISLLIFFSLSSSITEIMFWDNYPGVTDEYAQVIGWTSKNIPKDSRILLYPYYYDFRRMELDLYLYETFSLNEEVKNALINYELQYEDQYKWHTNKSAYGDVKLLYEENGRRNVILLYDKSNSGNVSILNDFLAPQTNGSISFWLKIDAVDENVDAGLNLRIYGEEYDEGIDFYINYGSYFYYNDSDINYMTEEYGANEWYYYQIYFNCNQSQGYWNVYMNGVQINSSIEGKSDLEFRGIPSNFSRVQISTTSIGKDYRVYFDVFNYSWAPTTPENDFYDRILNDISKLISYLNKQMILYFILEKTYIYEYQELIDYFYRIELFQYGKFILYKSIEI